MTEQNTQQRQYRAAKVSLDGFGTFPCLLRTDLKGWNGWACPFLDRAAVDDLIAATDAVAKDCPDGTDTLAWDGDTLVRTCPIHPDEQSERISPTMIDGTPYWSPGAFCWCWSEEKDA